jgi:hypothetical protein
MEKLEIVLGSVGLLLLQKFLVELFTVLLDMV